MSKKASEHHKKAAEHHESAAAHHKKRLTNMTKVITKRQLTMPIQPKVIILRLSKPEMKRRNVTLRSMAENSLRQS